MLHCMTYNLLYDVLSFVFKGVYEVTVFSQIIRVCKKKLRRRQRAVQRKKYQVMHLHV